MNGAIIQPVRPQRLDVGLSHLIWLKRHLLGEGAQRSVHWCKGGGAPVVRDGLDIGISFGISRKSGDLSTEVMRVGASSINAVIGAADDHRQHLTLCPAEG